MEQKSWDFPLDNFVRGKKRRIKQSSNTARRVKSYLFLVAASLLFAMEALQLRLTEFKKALNAAQEHEKKSLAAYNDAIDQFTQDPSNPEAARLQKNTSDAYTLAMTARAGAAQRVIEQQDLIAKSLAATNKDLLQSEKKHQTTVDKLRNERDQATTRAEAAA